MILAKLTGGLSNQMFQYAAARRLAYHHKTGLKLDISWYENIPIEATPRNFELNYFNINATIATPFETIGTDGVRNTKPWNLPIALYRKVIPRYRFIGERQFHFDERILNLPDNVCLFGHWVSEKYFSDISDIIQCELSVKTPLDKANRRIADKILATNSVSLHVRRGDYANNLYINSIHGLCSTEYYEKALNFIRRRVNNPYFFVFSDDLDWVAENMSLPEPVEYISNNQDRKSYEDIRLMSLCKHNIIANSGFSWWGGWLNANQSKIVCAPKQWFNNAPYDTKDIIPGKWVTL